MTKEEFVEDVKIRIGNIPSNVEIVKCDCGCDDKVCPGWKFEWKEDGKQCPMV